MASIRVDFEGLGDLLRRLGVRAEVALNRGLLSAANKSRAILVRESDRKRVTNTGNYRRAWKSERVVEVEPGRNETRRGVYVWNAAPYSGVIEYGRRPGAPMPPLEPIARWAQRKFRIPYRRARAISFAIARKIARQGIPGRFVLGGAEPALKQALLDEVRRELSAELRRGR
jgi:hypothetical protein